MICSDRFVSLVPERYIVDADLKLGHAVLKISCIVQEYLGNHSIENFPKQMHVRVLIDIIEQYDGRKTVELLQISSKIIFMTAELSLFHLIPVCNRTILFQHYHEKSQESFALTSKTRQNVSECLLRDEGMQEVGFECALSIFQNANHAKRFRFLKDISLIPNYSRFDILDVCFLNNLELHLFLMPFISNDTEQDALSGIQKGWIAERLLEYQGESCIGYPLQSLSETIEKVRIIFENISINERKNDSIFYEIYLREGALIHAIKMQADVDIVEVILNDGYISLAAFGMALFYANAHKNELMGKLLLNKLYQEDEKRIVCCIAAILAGEIELAMNFSKEIQNMDVIGQAIIDSSEYGHVDVVRHLLSVGPISENHRRLAYRGICSKVTFSNNRRQKKYDLQRLLRRNFTCDIQ